MCSIAKGARHVANCIPCERSASPLAMLLSSPSHSPLLPVYPLPSLPLTLPSHRLSSLPTSDIRRLRLTPCIPVANSTRLVPPTCLFARLSANLAPYLFELPRRFLQFSSILAELGMADCPSPSTLLSFLLSLYEGGVGGERGGSRAAAAAAAGGSEGRRLNPNELQAVLQILKLLCDSVKVRG